MARTRQTARTTTGPKAPRRNNRGKKDEIDEEPKDIIIEINDQVETLVSAPPPPPVEEDHSTIIDVSKLKVPLPDYFPTLPSEPKREDKGKEADTEDEDEGDYGEQSAEEEADEQQMRELVGLINSLVIEIDDYRVQKANIQSKGSSSSTSSSSSKKTAAKKHRAKKATKKPAAKETAASEEAATESPTKEKKKRGPSLYNYFTKIQFKALVGMTPEDKRREIKVRWEASKATFSLTNEQKAALDAEKPKRGKKEKKENSEDEQSSEDSSQRREFITNEVKRLMEEDAQLSKVEAMNKALQLWSERTK